MHQAQSIDGRDSWTEGSCRLRYPGIESRSGLTSKTLLLTAAIVGLTIAIETCVRSDFASAKPPKEASALERDGGSASNNESVPTTPQQDRETALAAQQQGNPSPQRRATRLVAASCFMIPCAVAFAFRIRDAAGTSYPSECHKLVEVASPNWILVLLFNIFPFLCSCTAWLRAFVDCVLVRWNRALSSTLWPPVLPICLVFAIGVMVFLTAQAVVLTLMGRSDLAFPSADGQRGSGSTELVGMVTDEERGLLHNDEEDQSIGSGRDSDDELTVYSPRSSLDGQKEVR